MLSLRSVWQRNFRPSLTVLWELLRDGLQFLNVVVRSRTAVAAEVVFLRKQLAYYQDHQGRPAERRNLDPSNLLAISLRYQPRMVSGMAVAATSSSAFRPDRKSRRAGKERTS